MQTIYLDISNKGVIPCIYAKQGDVDRKFLIVVTDGGVPFNCEDKAISVWYDGDSGEGNYTHIGEEDAISVTGNKITVSLIQQMLVNAGDGVLSVSVSDASGGQIGLWNIDYCVEQKPGAESEEATKYYDAFSKTAADIAKSVKTIGFAQERIDSILSAKNAAAAGLIYPIASANIPSGFLLCDGKEYSRTEYAELFEAIGTVYGIGDGETTFNVPNLQTRVPVGVGDGYELGETGGEEKHQLTVEELPSHSHYQNVANILDGSSVVQDSTLLYASDNRQTSFIGRLQDESTGGNQPYNNMQPYTVVNYIISTGKEVELIVSGGGGSGCKIDDTTIGADAWSSKNIVDKLCPSFTESGTVVTCEPIEGYPLEVISEIPYTDGQVLSSVTLTRFGKNLLGYNDFSIVVTNRTLSWSDGVGKISFSNNVYTGWLFTAETNSFLKNNTLLPGNYVFSIKQLSGTALTGVYVEVLLDDENTVQLLDGKSLTLTQNGTISGIKFNSKSFSAGEEITFTLQIEVGGVATEHEPYTGQTYTADFSEYEVLGCVGRYNWTTGVLINDADGTQIQLKNQPTPAYEGINTFVSSVAYDTGTIVIDPNVDNWNNVGALDDEFDVAVYCSNFIAGELIDTSVNPTVINPDAGGGNWTAEWWSGTDVKLHSDVRFDYDGEHPEYPRFAIRSINNAIDNSTGNTTVNGKKDLVKIIERLEATTNALLGG